MRFKEIIGQQEVKSRLVHSVSGGQIPHARLISGPEGVGKLPLAIAYAQYLNCENRQADDSCGTCPSCIKVEKLVHPDLHFVFPIIKNEKKKKTVCDDYLVEWREFVLSDPYFNLGGWLNHIGAENAQGLIYAKESDEIIRKLNLKAYESTYKVMIIWLPERIHESGANKLLKLIEEPPANTVFLLVSEAPDQVIGTIQSRTQLLPVPPIGDEDLAEALKAKYSLPEQDIPEITHLAKGSFLKAEEIIHTSDVKKEYLELFITIMRNSWTRDVKNMKAKAEYFASLGRERQKAFFQYTQQLIRENFVYRLNLSEINYMNRSEAGFSQNFSPYVNERNVIEMMEELSLAERHVESNVNPRMVFFDLSMKIAVLLKK